MKTHTDKTGRAAWRVEENPRCGAWLILDGSDRTVAEVYATAEGNAQENANALLGSQHDLANAKRLLREIVNCPDYRGTQTHEMNAARAFLDGGTK